ncbi:SCO family protein [Duganella sp. FT134W]|uniref:SCO family protein n=1 Tax=Duganella margarita TaxID=2692170 RepID=A0A7X4KFF0_9BURK|nr:SCO family protein [Duganella margarita]MYM72336.1 SCO family protein [Duganella margarita]
MKRTAIALAMFSAVLLASGRTGAQVHDHAPHALAVHAAAPTAALPATSLYQLATPLTDAAGRRFTLGELAGQPLLVTMFYGACHSACPVVIETLKRTIGALGPDGQRLQVLLVSLDPKRDTPGSLAMMARMQQLDPAQYRLAVAGNDSDTRTLAAALNIRYRTLDNGEISHTTRLALLNADGSVQADSTRLAVDPDPDFVRQIARSLKR